MVLRGEPMKHQRRGWMIVMIVFLVGVVGLLLLPMQSANAATFALSSDLSVNSDADTLAISHDERWVAFLGKSNSSNPNYNLYLVDTTVVPYTPLQITTPSLNENSHLTFSPQNRYLVIHRKVTTFQWEIYIYDLHKEALYLIASQQGYMGASITPDEQYLLLERFGGALVYSIPITGGNPIALTPDDFPISDYSLYFNTPTPDSRHVIMMAYPYTVTGESALGYAPITGTGTTIWRSTTEYISSYLLTEEGTTAYVSTDSRSGTDTLFRISLTSALTIPLLRDGQISYFGRADTQFAYVVYKSDHSISTLYQLNFNDDSFVSLFTTTNEIRGIASHSPTNRLIVSTKHDDQNIIYGLQYKPPQAATPLITLPLSSSNDYLPVYYFTPDGSRVVVGDRLNPFESRLYSVPSDGSMPPTPLLNETPVRPTFLPSVDNTGVWAVVRTNGFDRITYIPLDGTSPRTPFTPSDPNQMRLQDTIGQSQVLVHYVGTESGEISLYLTDPRPSIRIGISNTALAEGMSTPITLTITPSTTMPITMMLDITGTVSANDIELGDTTIVVPPDTTYITTTLTAIADGQPETPETLHITISALGDVVIETPATITLTLVDRFKQIHLPLIRYFD